MEQNLSSDADSAQLVKIFPLFYIMQRFDTVFTKASLEIDERWPTPSYSTSLRSTLILSSHLHIDLPSGLLPSRGFTMLGDPVLGGNSLFK
jgi:hypothetical protein